MAFDSLYKTVSTLVIFAVAPGNIYYAITANGLENQLEDINKWKKPTCGIGTFVLVLSRGC